MHDQFEDFVHDLWEALVVFGCISIVALSIKLVF